MGHRSALHGRRVAGRHLPGAGPPCAATTSRVRTCCAFSAARERQAWKTEISRQPPGAARGRAGQALAQRQFGEDVRQGRPTILRVETTIGNPKDFCVLRPRREDERGERHDAATAGANWSGATCARASPTCTGAPPSRSAPTSATSTRWRWSMTRRRARASSTPSPEPVVDDGRRFRAVRLSDPGRSALLEAISRGEFVTAGFPQPRPALPALCRPRHRQPTSAVSRAASLACSASCAPTASSARSPRHTATRSPSAGGCSPPPCVPPATLSFKQLLREAA